MLTATINALEERDVAVVDMPGAYLSADMDNEVHTVFRGTLAEMMVADDPELYRPFVSYKTGKAVLYVRLLKALYGCLLYYVYQPYSSRKYSSINGFILLMV